MVAARPAETTPGPPNVKVEPPSPLKYPFLNVPGLGRLQRLVRRTVGLRLAVRITTGLDQPAVSDSSILTGLTVVYVDVRLSGARRSRVHFNTVLCGREAVHQPTARL